MLRNSDNWFIYMFQIKNSILITIKNIKYGTPIRPKRNAILGRHLRSNFVNVAAPYPALRKRRKVPQHLRMQGRLALLRWQDMLVGLRGQSAICIKKAWRRMLWALRMHWKLSVLPIHWSYGTQGLLGIEHRSMPRNQHRQDIRWQWGNQIHELRRIHRETEKRGIVEIVWFNRYQWSNKFRNWKWLVWPTVPRIVFL